MSTKIKILQKDLSEECWDIQFWGISACAKCEYKNDPECSGQKIRETMKNKEGLKVPLERR